MHFQAVDQTESCITQDELAKFAPEHIRVKLVTATETNAHHLILEMLRP